MEAYGIGLWLVSMVVADAFTIPAPPAATDPAVHMPGAHVKSATRTIPSEMVLPKGRATVCAQLDRDHDGRISWREFKVAGRSAKDFAKSDVTHRGWLSLAQCSNALKR